jgi:beta-N-acetylhexosaminidase
LRFFRKVSQAFSIGLACLHLCAANALHAQTAPSLEQMIGQMLIVGFTGTSPADSGVKAVRQQIAAGTIGGVILLDRNIVNPDQLRRLTKALNPPDLAAPAFISVDQEGGRVQRLPAAKGFEGWESAEMIGEAAQTSPRDFTQRYYGLRAKALHSVGVNLNFAPDVDVNINPSNPIIGKLGRSFSGDSRIVAERSADFVRAHRANGVLTSLKHFPGHGSSVGDSHKILPSIAESWRPEELGPFEALAQENLVDMVMMGHLYHPEFSDAKGRPSSISQKGVDALRAIIGETGVIITDDMQMQAIQDSYPDAEAAVQAVIAGDDVLIFSTYKHPDPAIGEEINAAIRQAVKDGRISTQRIARSYYRILRLKQQL